MAPIGWQDLTALGVVGMAMLYLVRLAWRALVLRRVSRCGGCGSCPGAKPGLTEPALVQIERDSLD